MNGALFHSPIQISVLHCHNVMKFCMVNKPTIVNKFVLATWHCKTTHSAKKEKSHRWFPEEEFMTINYLEIAFTLVYMRLRAFQKCPIICIFSKDPIYWHRFFESLFALDALTQIAAFSAFVFFKKNLIRFRWYCATDRIHCLFRLKRAITLDPFFVLVPVWYIFNFFTAPRSKSPKGGKETSAGDDSEEEREDPSAPKPFMRPNSMKQWKLEQDKVKEAEEKKRLEKEKGQAGAEKGAKVSARNFITRPNCILWIVNGFRNKDALFDLRLFFCFLRSVRQNFNMFKDLSVGSRDIYTPNCASIQCTVWPRNIYFSRFSE